MLDDLGAVVGSLPGLTVIEGKANSLGVWNMTVEFEYPAASWGMAVLAKAMGEFNASRKAPEGYIGSTLVTLRYVGGPSETLSPDGLRIELLGVGVDPDDVAEAIHNEGVRSGVIQ